MKSNAMMLELSVKALDYKIASSVQIVSTGDIPVVANTQLKDAVIIGGQTTRRAGGERVGRGERERAREKTRGFYLTAEVDNDDTFVQRARVDGDGRRSGRRLAADVARRQQQQRY